MPHIIVLTAFKFAHEGIRVEEFEPSAEPRPTTDECAQLAVQQGWAELAKSAEQMADEAAAAEAKRLADEAAAAEAKRLADEASAAEAKRLADEAAGQDSLIPPPAAAPSAKKR